MRGLLGYSSGTDASKLVGIALGVAGGVIIITGILVCLYRRYAGLTGSLAGIPPERKTLVFTDLRKVQENALRNRLPYAPRFSGARAPSRVVLPVTLSTAAAHVADSAGAPSSPRLAPSPRASSRPTSALRAGGPAGILPALSVGLDVEPLPSAPGLIASPRGNGRVLFSTMDHPRSSNAGQAAAAVAIAGNLDDSRPGSSSTQQPRTSGFQGGGGGSRSGTIDGSGIAAAVGERPGSGGLAPSRHSSSGSAARRFTRGSVGAAAAVGPNALPPALIPTGSVTAAWKVPLAAGVEPGPERSLNSLAAGTTASPVETFDSAAAGSGGGARTHAVSVSGFGADGTLGRSPPPYRGSASGTSGPALAAVAAAAAGSLGAPAGATAFGNLRQGASRSRPGSGNDPSAAGGSNGAAAITTTGNVAPTASNLQRGAGGTHQSPRTSYGAGISVGPIGPVADDTISSFSGSISNFQSFSHSGEDGGAPHQHNQQHQHHQQRQSQQQRPKLDSQQSVSGGHLQTSAVVFQRSRLGPGAADANTSFTSSQSSTAGTATAGGTTGYCKWDALTDGASAPAPRTSPTPSSPPTASIGVTVAAAAAAERLKDRTAMAAAAAAASLEITEVESVGERGSHPTGEFPGLSAAAAAAAAATAGDGDCGGGSSGSNGALEVVSALETSAGDASPGHTTTTQSAWAAAVSLSSKLFGGGSRMGTPQTSPKYQLPA
ncbi:hypothetical protein Vretimale_10319 [Volvox reticuliferus]|nr:hypothetical protein Vretimale_10319 [Volvox reticuliferus]